MLKKILGVHSAQPPHWVGNAFPVRSLFSYGSLGAQLSPFLRFGHAGPVRFEAAAQPRGVGEHPHRGFETVTIVYEGEVDHRDTTGVGGHIGPGDVQWMTAASGILHQEFHSEAFTRHGGTLEMVQMWVNLPARDKMSAPSYQNLQDAQIPNVGGKTRLGLPVGHTAAVVVLRGTVTLNGQQLLNQDQMAHLEREHGELEIEANRCRVAIAGWRTYRRAHRRAWALRHEQPSRDQPGGRRFQQRPLRSSTGLSAVESVSAAKYLLSMPIAIPRPRG